MKVKEEKKEHKLVSHQEHVKVAATAAVSYRLTDTVDSVTINNRSQSVELSTRAESAASTWRWECTHKVNALDVEQTVEVVIVGNANLVTVRMFKVLWTLAALFGIVTVAWIWMREQAGQMLKEKPV